MFLWLCGVGMIRLTSQDASSGVFSPPGLLMNLKYYVSPYDLFEDGTGAPVVLHENNGRSAVELLLLLEGGKGAEFQPSSLCCHHVQQDTHRVYWAQV